MKTKIHPLVVKALKAVGGDSAELSLDLRVAHSTVYRWIKEGSSPSRLAKARLKEIINRPKSLAGARS